MPAAAIACRGKPQMELCDSPKTLSRKLKLFQAQFGFFDTVLAAPSQAAALRAWGTHRNLFATGDAKVATGEAAIAAAWGTRGLRCGKPEVAQNPEYTEGHSLLDTPAIMSGR